jgi:hypothetical protein
MSHSIVFSGKIRDGATQEETRRNLAEMFKIGDPAILERVFSGKPVILKKGLDENEARKQEMILYMAGAVCEVRVAPPPAPAPPVPAVADPAANADAAAATAIAPLQVVSPPLAGPARMQPGSRVIGEVAAPSQAMMPTARPLREAAPAAAAPLAMRNDAQDYLPAPLRGPLAMAAEPEAPPPSADPVVTNHGRPGEALLDPLHAPWDPAFVPDAVRGLSWAGFFAPLLWGSFNGMRLSFLPVVGIRVFRHFVPAWSWMVFYLAFGGFYLLRGRELAWENKQWRNAEHFNKVQRNWTIGSFLFFLLAMYGLVHLVLVEQQQKRAVAVAQELMQAEMGVMQASTPEAKATAIATRGQVREKYLAAMPDAATRERERQAFAEADREAEDENQAATTDTTAEEAPAQPQ